MRHRLLLFYPRPRAIHGIPFLFLIALSLLASRNAHATTLSTPRLGESASLLPNGDILVAGGQTSTNTTTILDTAELILPDGTDIPTGTMNMYVSSHTATVLPNGLVLVAGGVNNTGGVNSTTDIYNPTSNTWTTGRNLNVARFGHTATLLQNGNVLICGGYSDLIGTVNSSCDLYTPDMSGSYGVGTIAPGPTLSTPRAFHSATLLASGDVFMAGGSTSTTGGSYADTTEVYDPSSNSFGAGPGLIVERAFHTATALGDGRVLIAGGKNNNQTYPLNIGGTNVYVILVSTNEVEVYDPTSNTISPAAPMTESRREFPVTLDANGLLNAFGGYGSIPPASNSYPSWSVYGPSAGGGLAGPTFTNQQFTLNSSPIVTLKLSINTAGLISGGQVYVPPSQISFTSGTININAFTILIASGTGTCIYTAGGTPPWGCGVIAISSLPPLSGSVTCNPTTPCSYPISQSLINPSGNAATMSEETNNQTPVFVVISSMAFADEEIYNPTKNTWALTTAAMGGPNALDASSSNPPYDFAYFSMPALLTPDNVSNFIGGDQLNAGQTELGGLTSFALPAAGPSLPGPRAYHTATALPDGKIIIAGGQDVSMDTLSSSLIFDPTTLTFSAAAPLHVTRAYHTATLLPNGNVLAVGGSNYSTGTLSSAEIYNSTGSAWTVTGSMNQASQYHTATILPSGNVIVIGGVQKGSNYLSRTEIYYSTSGIWGLAASIPASLTNNSTGLSQHAATLLQNGTILVTGGLNTSGPLDTTEIYNPISNSWSAGPAMPSAVYAHTATLLSNGDVLVAGGDNGGGATAASIIYNPNTNAWTTVGSLNSPRLGHNAIILPDGDVLVSGGFASGFAIGSVERYLPYAGQWVFGGSMSSARGGHTTTLVNSGTIFDIGGLSALTGGSYLSNTDSFPFSVTSDLNTVGSPPSLRQPTVNAINIPVLLPGASVTVTGTHFHGVTEASGGGASSANSDQDKPRMILQSVDSANSFLIDLSTYIYANSANLWTQTDSSITIQLPATNTGLPYGWYQLREAANAQFSPGILVHAGPALPTQVPGIPSATVLSSAAVSWTWTAAGGTFDGYDVYSATNGVFLSTTSPAQLSYLESALSPNTTVQLLVAAYTLSGDGPGATSGINYTFAATPLSLAISSNVGSNLLLSWDPNNNSQGTIYEVSESTDGFVNSFSTPIPTYLTYTSTETTIQNLQMNTTYYFRVRAFNHNGIPSGFSLPASTTTVNQVSNLSGSPGGTTSIDWTWTSLQLPAGGYFAIYNATTTPEQIIATTINTYFSDIGLSTNTSRSIQVAAFTPAGEGPLTSTVTVYTGAALPASVNPSIVNVTTSGFTGVWTTDGNPAFTSYECTVTAINLSSTVFTTLTTSSTTALFCNVTGLPLPGSAYQTQVVALNGDGVATNPLNLGTTYTYAIAPSSLTVTGTTAGSISISWSTMTNSALDSYQITYSTDDFVSNVSTDLTFQNGLGISTLTISGLVGGYTYWIRAQADNPNGVVSTYSNVVSTITFNNGAPPGSSGIYVIASSQTYQTFTLGNGEIGSILIAANSFSQNTIIVISAIPTSPPLCPGTGSGVGLSITANPPEEPTTPITFTLSYSPAEVSGLNLSEASLMRVTGTNTCVPVETMLNQPSDQFTAKLNHISQFELAQVSPGTGVNAALIYPNPLYTSRGNGYVTFQNLPAGAQVRIYTVRGEMVFEGTTDSSGLFHWPGTNRGGRLVASGVYLVYIDSKGAHDIYKVAVER